MIIDSHCHLASRQFRNSKRSAIVDAARAVGVGHMITLGASLEDWEDNVSWAQEFPDAVSVCLGIHPDDVHEAPTDWARTLGQIHAQTPLVAIGETGLDYFHPAPEGWTSELFHAAQQKLLEEHFDLAEKLGLNIVLHTRDRKGSGSFEDAFAIARQYVGRVRPVFHCFIGNIEQAQRVFDELDGMVSFSGVATFKNARDVAEAARLCPLERLLVETDSPYLSPEPLRGRMNQPAHVVHTAEFIAKLKGISLDEFAEHTTQNAKVFFKLK